MDTLKAVFFDLYDTLVYADRRLLENKLKWCAEVCGVPLKLFSEAWKSLVVERNLGKFPEAEDRVRAILRLLNAKEHQTLIDRIVEAEHNFLKYGIFLFDDAIDTLKYLLKKDLKVGLVSNASPSVRVVLQNCKIDEYMNCTIISSDVGYRKPDPRIYQVAMKVLEVNASDCLFVGDGNDGELDGAHKLGMNTIWINRELTKYIQREDSLITNVDFEVEALKDVTDIIRKMGGKIA